MTDAETVTTLENTPRPAKADRATAETRVTHVFTMLVTGEPPARIVQYAAEKWQLAERQTRAYIRRANRRLAEQATVDRALEYGKAIERLNSLYSAAWKIKDYRTALSVQREITRLMNLSAAPPAPSAVTLKTPADVLAVVEAELNAVRAGTSTSDRARDVATLATAALKIIDLSDIADRLATLEAEIHGPQKAGHNGYH